MSELPGIGKLLAFWEFFVYKIPFYMITNNQLPMLIRRKALLPMNFIIN